MQSKATKNTPSRNAAEKHFHEFIFDHSICAACHRCRPLIGHHCEGKSFKHNKVLVGHFFLIGLCKECDDVVTNGSRKVFRDKFGPQSELWANRVDEYEFFTGVTIPFKIKEAIGDWGR